MDFTKEMEAARELIEARLKEFFLPDTGLAAAMRYSLLAGGKRIRPVLTMKFCEAAGGTLDEALDFACGVEMLHTYSLIHDDLPCMDNDSLRRGKPTNHKVFGECTATLAGDALQAAAFHTVLSAGGQWDSRGSAARVWAAKILAEAAGIQGMCAGQYWDTVHGGQPHTEEELTEINDKKTGALLRAACMLGVAASFGRRFVEESCMDAARDYATNLGLAFQIRDDILDEISTTGELGKTIGSDAANHKTTYLTLLGKDACKAKVLFYTKQAKTALNKGVWTGGTEFLRTLADHLAERRA